MEAFRKRFRESSPHFSQSGTQAWRNARDPLRGAITGAGGARLQLLLSIRCPARSWLLLLRRWPSCHAPRATHHPSLVTRHPSSGLDCRYDKLLWAMFRGEQSSFVGTKGLLAAWRIWDRVLHETAGDAPFVYEGGTKFNTGDPLPFPPRPTRTHHPAGDGGRWHRGRDRRDQKDRRLGEAKGGRRGKQGGRWKGGK